jgi:hypothetical protein
MPREGRHGVSRPARGQQGSPVTQIAIGGQRSPDAPQATSLFDKLAANMQRTAILLVMLFAMLWQSVAMARIGSTVNALADPAHATLHWQGAAHHHHEDGSYHQDDSKESVQHVVTDHLNASLALTAATSQNFMPLRSVAPNGLNERLAPSPALDRLLRPPRFRA